MEPYLFCALKITLGIFYLSFSFHCFSPWQESQKVNFCTLILLLVQMSVDDGERTCDNAWRLQWRPFPWLQCWLVDLHCCHHCEWTKPVLAQSVQTGSEHSMAAGWTSSFCCSLVATQNVASPPVRLVRPTLLLSPFVSL